MTDVPGVEVPIKHTGRPLPKYATAGAAGCDVGPIEDAEIPAGEYRTLSIGISVAIPPGYEIQVRPRSSLFSKFGLLMPNSPGTIDSDYRGEIHVFLYNPGNDVVRVPANTRIAQMVVCPVMVANFTELDDLPASDRGTGGFGSTGH